MRPAPATSPRPSPPFFSSRVRPLSLSRPLPGFVYLGMQDASPLPFSAGRPLPILPRADSAGDQSGDWGDCGSNGVSVSGDVMGQARETERRGRGPGADGGWGRRGRGTTAHALAAPLPARGGGTRRRNRETLALMEGPEAATQRGEPLSTGRGRDGYGKERDKQIQGRKRGLRERVQTLPIPFRHACKPGR